MKKIVILGLALAFILTGCAGKGGQKTLKPLTPEEAKVKVTKFINEELLGGAEATASATVTSISEEGGVYKVAVKLEGQGRTQEIESFMTKDGARFFDRSFDMNPAQKAAEDTTPKEPAPAPTVTKKSAKPAVEVFVMSYCPFGLQIQKGLLPVLEKLGSKIDFKLKFCDYAMHQEKELIENMNQYCIQKVEPAKLVPYLKCFTIKGDYAQCATEAKVTKSKIASCVATTDKTFKVKETFANQSAWGGQYPPFNVNKEDNVKYGVGGSPTLVINGETISPEDRSPANLLAAICSAFEKAPAECQAQLSTANPSSGIGAGTDTSGAAAAGCAN